MNDIIPAEVRDFIIRHIDSVSQLEALLILHAHPEESWEVRLVASRVYASDQELGAVLERFAANGFLKREDDRYRYDGKDSTADRTIAKLARCYASHLIPITNMIHSKPRLMRSFSDAFKLRKD